MEGIVRDQLETPHSTMYAKLNYCSQSRGRGQWTGIINNLPKVEKPAILKVLRIYIIIN
jgi:hypothetical protein